jgi:hypothetical protein
MRAADGVLGSGLRTRGDTILVIPNAFLPGLPVSTRNPYFSRTVEHPQNKTELVSKCEYHRQHSRPEPRITAIVIDQSSSPQGRTVGTPLGPGVSAAYVACKILAHLQA